MRVLASGKPNVGYQDLVSLISPLAVDSPHGECQPPLHLQVFSSGSATQMGWAQVTCPILNQPEARGMLHAAGVILNIKFSKFSVICKQSLDSLSGSQTSGPGPCSPAR